MDDSTTESGLFRSLLSRAETPQKRTRALQAAEKLVPRAVLKGHEFIRADKSIGLTPALAAEGCISQFFSEFLTFSAAC